MCVCVSGSRGLQCQGVDSAAIHHLFPTTYRLGYISSACVQRCEAEVCHGCIWCQVTATPQRDGLFGVSGQVQISGVDSINQDGHTNRIKSIGNVLNSVLCENPATPHSPPPKKNWKRSNRDQEIQRRNGGAEEESKISRMCVTADGGRERG